MKQDKIRQAKSKKEISGKIKKRVHTPLAMTTPVTTGMSVT